MELSNWIMEFAQLTFYIAGVALASGWITTALTQLLKWKLISIPATKYPTIVAGILSFALAVPAVILTGLVEATGWYSYVIVAIASLFVATNSYDTIKKMLIEVNAN